MSKRVLSVADESIIAKTVGRSIREQRELRGWSQIELARACGENPSAAAICKWETGNHLPHTVHLFRLCFLFDCILDDLLNVHDPKLAPIIAKTRKDVPEKESMSEAEARELLKGSTLFENRGGNLMTASAKKKMSEKRKAKAEAKRKSGEKFVSSARSFGKHKRMDPEYKSRLAAAEAHA